MNKIAIMQPYFYPYFGYFELIKQVDCFVFLTDVQYVRRSWMCRNRVRFGSEWQYIRVGVKKAPQNTLIYNMQLELGWLEVLNKILIHTYGKKIESHPVFDNLQKYHQEINLCKFLCETTQFVANYLGIITKFADSRDYRNVNYNGQEGLIEIMKNIGGKNYINASGGADLYNKDDFLLEGLQLEFMPSCLHVNKLSMLDLIFGDNLCSL